MNKLWRSVFVILAAAQPANAQAGEAMIAIVQGTEMLKQCSRQSPLSIDGTWAPTLADVQRLERLLPSALAGKHGSRFDAARVLSGSARQYTGFKRDGKQYLYGSFFPANTVRALPEWHTRALVICDGGPSVFGVEMELGSERITHISFNGP